MIRLADSACENLVVDTQLLVTGAALGVGEGHLGDTLVDRCDAVLVSGSSLVQELLQDLFHKPEGGLF